MEDLCNLFRKQSITCPDENNVNLKQGFDRNRSMLRRATCTVFSQSELETYLRDLHKRYEEYARKLRFKGSFAYLTMMLQGILEKIDSLRKYTGELALDKMQEILQVMLIAFFIDCDLLFAIGACYMEDDEIEHGNVEIEEMY